MRVRISEEDCNNIQEKFFNYNALVDVVSQIQQPTNETYEMLLLDLKHEKYELEVLKRELAYKYAPENLEEVKDYKFDFYTSEIEYD